MVIGLDISLACFIAITRKEAFPRRSALLKALCFIFKLLLGGAKTFKTYVLSNIAVKRRSVRLCSERALVNIAGWT